MSIGLKLFAALAALVYAAYCGYQAGVENTQGALALQQQTQMQQLG